MEKRIDCFAYKPRSCEALTKMNCDGCGFYKTKEELKASQEKAMKRIKTLDPSHQKHIQEMYFRRGGIKI